MHNSFRGALLIAGLGLCGSASAEFYVGGLGTYYSPDSSRYNADDGFGSRGVIGFPVKGKANVELGVFSNTYEPETGSGYNRNAGLGADVLVPFTTGTFRPFGLAGVSYMQERIFGAEEETFAGNVGLGALIRVLPNVDLRAEARYLAVLNDLGGPGEDPFFDLTAGFGLQSYFGGAKQEEVAVGPCVDSDGDGVCDDADLCPGTPPGTTVDAKGCPVVEKQPTVSASQKLGTVYFAFDKSDLSSEAMATLDSAAATIGDLSKTYPSLKVEVSGHTDWIGTDGYNQGLSERRANSAKNYLVRKGVNSGRIATFAYGESRPVAPNSTPDGKDDPAGRALNRRAELETRGE